MKRRNRIMNKLPALISGLAIGATLMYIFDPQKGTERRNMIRDKATGLKNDAQERINSKTEDLTNRAKGLLEDTKKAFTNEETQEEDNFQAAKVKTRAA